MRWQEMINRGSNPKGFSGSPRAAGHGASGTNGL